MKKTTIIIKDGNLGDVLNQFDQIPNLEHTSKTELEDSFSKEFDINVLQKEVRDFGEENLQDLLDKLHALPDDELQDTLRTYPTIKEIWHKHFADWTFGSAA